MTPNKARMTALKRRATIARNGWMVTCPASRHTHMIALALAEGRQYPMLAEDPQECAETLLAVVAALWEARAELAKMKAAPGGA